MDANSFSNWAKFLNLWDRKNSLHCLLFINQIVRKLTKYIETKKKISVKNKTKVINFYGGPGSGKSTKAAGLYYKMNMAGYSVELNNEFAKECVWEDNVPMLKDQLFIIEGKT